MDNNNRKDEQNKKNNRNGIILCLVVAIGVFLVFSFMQRQVKSATNKEITYDRFLEMLEDGQVKSVVLTSNEIKITPVTQQNTIYKMTYYTGSIWIPGWSNGCKKPELHFQKILLTVRRELAICC